MLVECKYCHKEFKGTHNSKFCSKECNKNWKDKNKTNCICHTCGKHFFKQTISSKIKYHFCSRKCYNEFKKTKEYKKIISDAYKNKTIEEKQLSKEKYEATMLERHGVKHNWASKDDKINGRGTQKILYGGIGGGSEIIAAKTRSTKLERYGNEYYTNSEKYKETWYNKTEEEKEIIIQARKQGILDKYNMYYPQTEEFKAIFKDPEKEKIRLDKIYKTKLKHGTLTNTYIKPYATYDGTMVRSTDEVYIYNKFYKLGIKVEYEHYDDRYPYPCDFYLPDRDLFIEYQGFISHGNLDGKVYGPYDPKNEEHRELLRFLKESNYSMYESILNTWTLKDPEKREVVKKNKLNWVFYIRRI